jgi:LCP family protein required for cell wall assembly
MIENELRATFERAEILVPAADALVPGINATARRYRARRRLIQTAAAVVLVLVAVAVPTLWRGYLGRLAQSQPAASGAVTMDGALNILIVGLDAPDLPNHRTDAIVLAHVPADRSAVYLVGIPRDTLADIPGNGKQRINAAFAIGQAPLLLQTASQLTGLSFNGSIVVDYQGLTSVVDGLGGIRLCVDEKVTVWPNGRTFDPGCHLFTGEDALLYLRQRHNVTDGALGRDRHVAQFLAALADKAVSASDLTRMTALLRLGGAGVTIDVPGADAPSLAWQVRGALHKVVAVEAPWSVQTVMDQGSVVVLTPDATGLFEALRMDTMGAWVATNPSTVEKTD